MKAEPAATDSMGTYAAATLVGFDRDVVAPGTAGLRAVAERFGSHLIKPDGTLVASVAQEGSVRERKS